MEFSSLIFVCIFLPLVLILHTVIRNRKGRNGLLLAASLLFYAFGEPVYVFLMLLCALYNYGFALLIGKYPKKPILAAAVAVNIGVLSVFKYTDFLLESLNTVFGLSIPLPGIPLPIGISFFTFQALSYVIDVFRGKAAVQKNYAKLLLYISFFPQLIAGPIVRYQDIEHQIDERTVTMRRIAFGLRRFIVGLGKKVLIANAMGAAADAVFNRGAGNINLLASWIGAFAYLMQIYYDFSGYSDMAIGLGKMFGFRFRENFDHPYRSSTVQEFWRRWHISLSSWFKDYVYIPLGGNRKGKVRTVLNRIVVFFLTGLWHGANLTFVVWGLFHGFFLLLEEAVPKLRKLPKVVLHVYTLLVVTVGFVVFRADTMAEALRYIAVMFSPMNLSADRMSAALQILTPYFLVMLVAAVLGCGPLAGLSDRILSLENSKELTVRQRRVQVLSFVLSWLLLLWCIIRLMSGSYNPFIYFRF